MNMSTYSRLEELTDVDLEAALPPWLSASFLSLPKDELETFTSTAQLKTEEECMPYLLLKDSQGLQLNSHGLPKLRREAHIAFLNKAFEGYPAPYMALDAARPWFFYWVLQGLTALGQDVQHFHDRLISTLRPLQSPTGGFAGGHGQYGHSAPTYACVLALAMVDGLHMIDRTTMWHFLGRLKQADGGFHMADGAEEDIRGAYCAVTVISLLNLPLDLPSDAPARKSGLTSFLDGLGEYVGRCQTFEGGISGAPGFEAHGAYAFCALACLSIIDAPSRSIARYLDVPALGRWMADMQTTPEGGFAGRTNKLVDACYSQWIGGSWALLEAAGHSPSYWNRPALVRYLLTCCQQPGKKGGMRDKPSAKPDAYHTCYSLSGLSAAEHIYTYDQTLEKNAGHAVLPSPYCWTTSDLPAEQQAENSVDEDDIVEPLHPVFVISFAAVEMARDKLAEPLPVSH